MAKKYFFMRGRKYDGIERTSAELMQSRKAEREIDHLRTQDMMKLDGDERRAAIEKRRKQTQQVYADAEGAAAEHIRRG